MSGSEEFQVRPGRIRDRGGGSANRTRSFVSEVLHAANRAGGRGRAGRSAASGSRFGRGRGAAILAGLHAPGRRVAVKARVVRHAGARFRAAPLATHVRYLRRDGVDRSGGDAPMFDAASDNADEAGFVARTTDDRHHFRFMVSPEDATQLVDLKATTRELMAQAEADLDTRLDWIAVDHWNTDNPHVHILIRGVTSEGADLVISRDYISRGFRARAEALVSLELGPRSGQEVAASLQRETRAERWTGLDRAIQGMAQASAGVVDLRPGGSGGDRESRRLLLGRMETLQRLGLATPEGPGAWVLHSDHQMTLRALGERGDIIATLHRATGHGRSAAEIAPCAERSVDPVAGRLLGRGLHDEMTGEAYVIIDAIDGRVHHARVPSLEASGDTPVGGLVELRPANDGRAAHLVHRADTPLAGLIEAPGATWLDRQLVSREPVALAYAGFGAEVRAALEARAARLADQGLARPREGGWSFAGDLIATLRARELRQAAQGLAARTGLEWREVSAGEAVAGRYIRRLDLTSGRFAMIGDGLGFQLVPWSRQLEPHLGKSVSGTLTPGGGVEWSLGRRRGLSL